MVQVIRAGQLIDGTGSEPQHDMAVMLAGERITAVAPWAAADVPPDADVLDARDATVLPGLIDAHTHIYAPGRDIGSFSQSVVRDSYPTMALHAFANARKMLAYGYTTLRDVHALGYVDIAVRDAINTGIVEGPRLKVSGQGLCITGGHMDRAGFAPQVTVSGRVGVVDSPDGFRAAAREQIKRGADRVKINACGGSTYSEAEPWTQEMTFAEMCAACDEAHRHHRRVAAHTSGGPPVHEAILAGVDTVEHGHWLSDETLALMVERGTWYIPTLIVNSMNFTVGREALGASAKSWRWLELAYEAKWDTLTRAKGAGVKIGAGSDAGFLVEHGENALELVELVKGGFTPLEAITAATGTNADVLDMVGEAGVIAPGCYADVLICDADPLTDIAALTRPEHFRAVLKGGQIVAGTRHTMISVTA